MKTAIQMARVFLLGMISLVACAQLAHAEDDTKIHPYLTDTFIIDIGLFFPDRQFGIQVNSAIEGPNDPIDFEADFGVKQSEEVFSLDFAWRFGEKWQFEGQYFGAGADESAVLEEDVEWQDVTFLAGTGVGVGQEFAVFRTFFARRFESAEHQEFGLGAGVHWLKISAYIAGDIETEEGLSEFRRESVSALAPLPNIGAWYMRSLSPKWAFRARADWFGASIDSYSGSMTNVSIGLNYQIFKYAGLGLNYNAFNLDIDVDKSDWRGSVETSYEGPFVHLSFYW